jgi:hypothetical protein
VPFLTVPFQGDPTVFGSCHVYSDLTILAEDGLEVVQVFQGGVLDQEVVHNQVVLCQKYQITAMAASKYHGMTLEWNYVEGYVIISVPRFVEKALQEFTYPPPPGHNTHLINFMSWMVIQDKDTG